MRIKIHTSASWDLVEGFNFYENQIGKLGSYFLDSLYSDIDSLIITAGVHEVHFKKYFRMLTKRFPFAVYYKIKNNIVHVIAVLDCRRKPSWVRSKLSEL